MKMFKKLTVIALAAATCLQIGAAYTQAAAATSIKEMTRNIAEGFNGAFNLYKNGRYDGTESMLLLDGEVAWCVEPATEVGAGWTDFTSSSLTGSKWLGNRYGWSEEKVGNLSKAIYFAKNHFGDKASDYVLVQNLIWSSITSTEDASQSGSYVLTSNSKAYRSQLDTKAKLDAAMNTIWAKVSDYNRQPSWNGNTVTGEVGTVIHISDANSVSDDIIFNNIPSGIRVTKTAGGIDIQADNSFAGKTITLNYYKSQIPYNAFHSDSVTIYEHTGRQSISMWNMAMNPTAGTITVTYDIPVGDAYIRKVSATNSDTVVGGAEYTVYTDEACTAVAKDIEGNDAVFTTTADGTGSNLITFECGSYYVKETRAAEHYTLDAEHIYTLKIEKGKTTTVNEGIVSDPPKAKARIQKVSEQKGLTADNNCYSLEGAVYGFYSDSACENLLGQAEADIYGETDYMELDSGIYYIKEICASVGYELSNEVKKIVLEPGDEKTFTMDETPVSDTFHLNILKGDADTEEFTGQGIASLEGAVFEIAYFDNVDGNSSGTAVKKWYFQTDEQGEIFSSDSEYLISSRTMNDGRVYTSDELYCDQDGNIIYPLGTYKIKEISPPKYYRLAGSMCFVGDPYNAVSVTEGLTAVISEENDEAVIRTGGGKDITGTNLAIAAYDEIFKGSITVQKYDGNGTAPLQGVKFKLEGSESKEIFTGTTNADGQIVFSGLIPQHYTLTEISTAAGKNLMKNPIDVTVPLEMSYEEINASGADIKKAVWDEAAHAYCFYDSTYEVSNEAVFEMPMTGGTREMLYVGMAVAAGLVCAGIFLAVRFRRNKI